MKRPAQRTRIAIADEAAVVTILEILNPFPREVRQLILATVEANPDYPAGRVSGNPDNQKFLRVFGRPKLAVAK